MRSRAWGPPRGRGSWLVRGALGGGLTSWDGSAEGGGPCEAGRPQPPSASPSTGSGEPQDGRRERARGKGRGASFDRLRMSGGEGGIPSTSLGRASGQAGRPHPLAPSPSSGWGGGLGRRGWRWRGGCLLRLAALAQDGPFGCAQDRQDDLTPWPPLHLLVGGVGSGAGGGDGEGDRKGRGGCLLRLAALSQDGPFGCARDRQDDLTPWPPLYLLVGGVGSGAGGGDGEGDRKGRGGCLLRLAALSQDGPFGCARDRQDDLTPWPPLYLLVGGVGSGAGGGDGEGDRKGRGGCLLRQAQDERGEGRGQRKGAATSVMKRARESLFSSRLAPRGQSGTMNSSTPASA